VVAPLPAVEKTLHEFRGSASRSIPPRRPHAELEDPDTLEWMGRFIARIHAWRTHAVRRAARTRHRNFPVASRAAGCSQTTLFLADLLEAWRSAADLALAGVRAATSARARCAALRLHGDCHAGNVLWTTTASLRRFRRLPLGAAIQDLWMLLSGDRASMTRQLGDVLAGYEDFHDFDPRELHLLEALRTLRLIHYSAWLAPALGRSAFPPLFLVQHAALLAGPDPGIEGAESR